MLASIKSPRGRSQATLSHKFVSQAIMTTLKLCFQNDLRRVPATVMPDLDYASLVDLTKQLFGLTLPVTLKYKDEEHDFVTISCDEDLLEAKRIVDTQGWKTLCVSATLTDVIQMPKGGSENMVDNSSAISVWGKAMARREIEVCIGIMSGLVMSFIAVKCFHLSPLCVLCLTLACYRGLRFVAPSAFAFWCSPWLATFVVFFTTVRTLSIGSDVPRVGRLFNQVVPSFVSAKKSLANFWRRMCLKMSVAAAAAAMVGEGRIPDPAPSPAAPTPSESRAACSSSDFSLPQPLAQQADSGLVLAASVEQDNKASLTATQTQFASQLKALSVMGFHPSSHPQLVPLLLKYSGEMLPLMQELLEK